MEADNGKPDDTSRTAWFTRAQFQHSLLLVMPLPHGVPSGLVKVQRLVRFVMTEDTNLSETVEALRELGELVDRCAVSDGTRLVIEVIEQVLMRLTSPRLSMLRVSLLLKEAGLRIATEGPATMEPLTGKPLNAAEDVPREALETLATAAQSLGPLSKEDLATLGADECRAAIQVVLLHAQHGFRLERGRSKHQKRLEYLRGTGLEVWKKAVDAMREIDPDTRDFRLVYGRQAYRQTRTLLQRRAQGEDAPASLRDVIAAPTSDEYHQILLEDIPPGTDREERTQLEKYQALSRPLRLAAVPSVDHLLAAEARLIAECPWGRDVIASVFRELVSRSAFGSKRLGLSPFLFVGPPGLGKSRLARRIAEEIGVLLLPLPFGAMADSHLLTGTSRGWSTAHPSPILTFMLTRQTPSVIVLADEIDKSQGRYSNAASPHSSLLALLEPETACSWVDQYLQAPCNMTSLMFLATANSIDELPAPLLSRFTVLHFAKPDPKDLIRVVDSVLDDIAKEWHIPRGQLPNLHGAELLGPLHDMRDVRRAVLSALAEQADPRRARKSVVH